MAVVTGWLYCFLWYTSILAEQELLKLNLRNSGAFGLIRGVRLEVAFRVVSSLVVTMLPIPGMDGVNRQAIASRIFMVCGSNLALLEILCGCDIQVSGDPVHTGETSILVMNHRTRTDWNFFWPTIYHSVIGKNKLMHSTKLVLKDVIRHVPGPGWVMQLACFVYIKRCWLLDKAVLQKYIDYIIDNSYKHSLLLFPEGTDFTENTKRSSDSFAEKHFIQKYDYVLHPRTTGFIFLTHQLLSRNNLDAVYDITLVYPDVVPQNEKVLLNGHFPKVVKVHFVRYPKSILPKTEEGLKEFLEKRWLDKEKTIKEFKATGHFLHGQILKTQRRWELYVALVFWSLLPYVTLYFFMVVEWFRSIVIAHTLFLVGLNFISDGFQHFEISLYNLRRRK